jgi:hypothetical protein
MYNGGGTEQCTTFSGHPGEQDERLTETYCCRKPTHTDLYLHEKSEHYLSQKQAALKRHIHWAKTICNALALSRRLQIQKEKLAGIAMILFQ